MRLQVGRVDHQPIRWAGFRGQGRKYAIEHAHPGPSDEPVVQGLMRSVDLGRVTPSQPIANDVNDAADNPTIIHTGFTVGSREGRLNALELGFREPVMIRHEQFLLPT